MGLPSSPSDPQAILEVLQQLPLCNEIEACSPSGLKAMAPLGRIEDIEVGTLVFELGNTSDTFRFVVSGRIALFVSDARGNERTVGTVSGGDLLGWSSLRDPASTYTLSARARKDTRCVAFPGNEIRELCGREREFGYCLMKYAFEAVARRLTDARLQMLDVYRRD